MRPKKYGVCWTLFDTPCKAAAYAASVMTAQEMATIELFVIETDTVMTLRDYLALPESEKKVWL